MKPITLTIGVQTDIPAVINESGWQRLFELAEYQDRFLMLAYANPDRTPMYRSEQMTSHMTRFLRLIAIRARKAKTGLPVMRGDLVLPGPNWKLLVNGLLLTVRSRERLGVLMEPRHVDLFVPKPTARKTSTVYAKLRVEEEGK